MASWQDAPVVDGARPTPAAYPGASGATSSWASAPAVAAPGFSWSDDAIKQYRGKPNVDVVYMTPKQYLTLSPEMKSDPATDKNGSELTASLKKGDQVEKIPSFSVKVGKDGQAEIIGQDGRHRAQFAQEHGLDMIPVAIKRSGSGDIKSLLGMQGYSVPFDFQRVDAKADPSTWRRIPPTQAPEPEPTGYDRFVRDGVSAFKFQGDIIKGVGNVASQALLTPIAGLAGLGTLAARGMGLTQAEPTSVIERVLGAAAPRNETQATVQNVLTLPFKMLGKGADWLGDKTLDATGSPLAATAVNTGVNMLPAILGMGSGKYAAASTADAATAANAAQAAAAARAAAAVESKAGVSWSALPDAMRVRLSDLASDATRFDALDGESLNRVIRAEAAGVKLTRGQATRDPVQMRVEEQTAATEPGASLRARFGEQNDKLTANVDELAARQRSKNPRAYDSGKAVSDVVAKQADRSSKNITFLYDKAKNSPEGKSPVSPAPLIDWLTENGAAAASVPQINSIAQMLKKFGAVDFDEAGTAIKKRDLTLNETEDIRKLAVKLGKSDDSAGHFMGEVKKVIDDSTKDTGGKLYKDARAARIEHAKSFEDPSVVSDLTEMKSRTDRKVPFEDVWQRTVMKSGVDDLARVKKQLLTGDTATVDAGRAAWRDLRAQTIDFIREKAANKSVAPTERGTAEFSPGGLKKALENIGDDKLSIIFDKATVRQLRDLDQVARDVKTMPATVKGSPTSANLLVMLDKVLGHIPVVGSFGRGVVRIGAKVKQEGNAVTQAKRLVEQDITEGKNALARPRTTLNKLLELQGRPSIYMLEMGNENRQGQR